MSEEISASHILCSTESIDEKNALKTITELQTEIEGGADFSELAQKHSDCPSSSRGGDLGSFSRGQMVEEFDKVAFNLEIGEVSDLVKTEFGFHIIYRTA